MMEVAVESFGGVARQGPAQENSVVSQCADAQRNMIVFERLEFDSLIGARHPARVVWSYVQQVDLSSLFERTSAGHSPGQPPPDPRVVLALWLYASIEGIGSALQLERMSEVHHGFRWLRAGVPLNHQLLSDFRWQAPVVVDRLLIQGVAVLWSEGLVSLASLSEVGIRIRASTSTSMFRKLATWERLLDEAAERTARLRQEIDGRSDVSNCHLRSIRERALREK